MNTPLIKWTGSKRSLSKEIISHFPSEINTYYEPFVGGGSVFLELLKNDNLSVKNYILSDVNQNLIEIFNIVKNNPEELILSYKDKWLKLQNDKEYYYKQREEYNISKDSLIFYFLTRTCYNGTIRYNKRGEFNTSLHFGRPGMSPEKIENVLCYYNNLMKNKNITFLNKSFECILSSNKNDVVYLDPPYTNNKTLYFGNIDINILFSWIKELPCSWFMNINGVNNLDNEISIDIPYTDKKILISGKSGFSKLKQQQVQVGEYFYYNLKE